MSGTTDQALYKLLARTAADGGLASSVPQTSIAVWNGTSMQMLRTPTIFKVANITAAGNTAIWTPAAGKKFRLMGFAINVTGNAAAAAAGVLDVRFQDNTTPIGLGYSCFIPATAGSNFQDDSSMGFHNLINGYLSTTANNALNVNLSFALTAGVVMVVAIGTEE